MEKLLFYCSKAKSELFSTDKGFVLSDFGIGSHFKDIYKLNGKIVGMCDCDFVEEITCYSGYKTESLSTEELYKASCLSGMDMHRYLRIRNGYALHLSNVKVFDKSKELSDYFQFQNCCMNSFGGLVDDYYPIKKAPKNMCFAYDKNGNRFILISIKSKPLFEILNGSKTIEVRKAILNILKEIIV